MNKPCLSIVIPVYNAVKYLEQCVKSILSQSFINYEIILVDDGSTDGSSRICDEYEMKDKRIKVLHQSNAGASHARNIGIRKAQGDYIWFIDADDWIEDGFLSKLPWDRMADIVFFGFKRITQSSEDSCRITSSSQEFDGDLGEVLCTLFVNENQFFGYTWNKIFKRSIILDNDILFREHLIIKEDEVFTLEYCKHIATLLISSATPYNYRVLDNSVSHSIDRKRNMYELATFLESEIENPSYPSVLRDAFHKAIACYYFESLKENVNKEQFDSAVKNYINFCRKHVRLNQMSLKNRILFYLPTDVLKSSIIKYYLAHQ